MGFLDDWKIESASAAYTISLNRTSGLPSGVHRGYWHKSFPVSEIFKKNSEYHAFKNLINEISPFLLLKLQKYICFCFLRRYKPRRKIFHLAALSETGNDKKGIRKNKIILILFITFDMCYLISGTKLKIFFN